MATLAERISANQGAIAQRVATMVVSQQAGPEILAQLLTIRKEYLTAFEDLKSSTASDEGKRLLGRAEQAAAQWRDADNRVLDLLKAQKPAEAAQLHQEVVVPRFNELGATIAGCVAYHEKRLASINEDAAATLRRTASLLIGLGLLSVIGAAVAGVVLARSIAQPLGVAVAHLDQVACGNLRDDLPREYLERADEIGLLCQALQTMSVSLRDVVSGITGGIHVVSSSSTELSSSSGQMSSGARQASDKAHAVAAAAEQMTANVGSVAAGMEETSTNLANVATSTEQMTATIGEIAGNSEKARRITEQATQQAARISEQMNQLGQAAREIGKVTETITAISTQTNLLALNATIEAARAGAAGKGFAVVANEIKALAQQTASATEDIKKRIGGVQSSTAGGVKEIEKISTVIHEVSDIVASIAAAIEEQATVTKDIARSIGEASTGVRDANLRVAESSQATQDIAREIGGIDETVRQMAEGSEQVQASAADLSRVAEQLQTAVEKFQMDEKTGESRIESKVETRMEAGVAAERLPRRPPVTTARSARQRQPIPIRSRPGRTGTEG
jgi:methyl-accepting chemotaxis protein